MALTGMAIYKMLPKTNCGDCKFPTCMAFAMQVASKQKALTDCPHLSEQAKAEASDASAPPMKLVRVGLSNNGALEIGQETVMFRHEERFHRKPGVAVRIPASLTQEQALARLEQINAAQFTRVGQKIGVSLAAVELEGLAPADATARVKALAAATHLPFVLMGTDAAAMAEAVKAVADRKPLIYRAGESNAEAFTKLAADAKCPLAMNAPTLEKLADLAKAARDKGVADLVLSFDGAETAKTIRSITMARRAALRKGFKPLGFPTVIDVSSDDPLKETMLACTFAAKYAGIIIVNGVDSAELLPILTTIQNIYTDPQVPNTVEAKLYRIGNVTDSSPVLFTTNFSLTYFSVEGEIERSKVPAFICVVETEGLGVLNAYAGDKLSPEKVVKALQDQKVAEQVKHRRLIIPGLLPAFKSEIEATSEWKEVLIGPENASGIPAFLTANRV